MADREFLEKVIEENEAGLLRYAEHLLNNPHEAQDAVQNAFLKLVKVTRTGNAPKSAGIRCWLYRVVHNAALDIIRKETRLRNLHAKHMEYKNIEGSDRSESDMKEKYGIVLQQVESLDEKTRQVLLLRLEEGLSYKDIAKITGRTTGNVGCILYNAVKNIAENLKNLGIITDHTACS